MLSTRRGRRRVAAVILSLSLAACGGGSGGGGEEGKPGEAVYYDGAVTRVDGRVGDSPFHDDDTGGGLADGRLFAVDNGKPVTIEWSPSTLQVDQRAVGSLAGYRIYFGHQPGNQEFVIELGEPDATRHRLAGLPQGTYYFVVSAVDGWNREGPVSNVATVTVE